MRGAGLSSPAFQPFRTRKEKGMKRDSMMSISFAFWASVLLVSGCGEKKVAITEVPREPEAKAQVKTGTPPAARTGEYTVKEGDTLWAISSRSENYSDPFQWPSIFKTNRDEIRDPDLISPGQVLLIERGRSAEQVEQARKSASDTPAFVEHKAPREKMPVDYF